MAFFLGGRNKGGEASKPGSTLSRFSLRDKHSKEQASRRQSRDDSDSDVEEVGNVFSRRPALEKRPTATREPRKFLGEEFPTDAPRTRSSVQRAMEQEAEELEAEEAEENMRWNPHRGPSSSNTRHDSRASGAEGSSGMAFRVRSNPAFQVQEDDDSSGSDTAEVIVRRPDNPQAILDYTSGPLRGPALHNLAQRALFLNTPAPQDKLIQCYVRRDKDRTGLYPQFQLYLTNGDQFLLAARRRKKSNSSNYLVSLDPEDLARGGAGFHAKLRSNYVGTSYTLYNNGLKPGKGVSQSEERKELGAIFFKSTALQLKGGPRMMTVVLPFPESFNGRLKVDEDKGLAKRWKDQKKGKAVTVIGLQNKKPVW
eukprot:CAMPEP_0118927274 /NCGR_PEP_ID=MMETSP1169-20130426/4782_1 /TAXON_ID=36882 /ORGANISM="Pyramimonas obovata, Strain CCMP722" /LENGTH=367 /DNA_ID=CAMNT_0006869011 /DNA_START=209 /DNA_END=1309 /DNA_ORIENTATION=+